MKRLMVLLGILVVLTWMFACSAPAEPTPEPTVEPAPTPVQSPTQEPTEPAPDPTPEETEAPKAFAVSSAGIVEGAIADEYGKRGSEVTSGTPTRSLPLSIENPPQDTACYAIAMVDPDSVPLCGYEWVHWLAANFTATDLPANASVDMAGELLQGKNSFGSVGYGGPTPPDKPHTYVIRVYALNAMVDLAPGFTYDEFKAAVDELTIETYELTGSYAN